VEKVKRALEGNPALIYSQDNNGETPLHWAASMGHKDAAELLRQRGSHE
jgi:ankyrin repeat protein